ncbi:MAG: DUF3768 domain-containing protein [Formivibrio sp.]|nr:DUF3768 domain-containing protein [Formivibrio sp.]
MDSTARTRELNDAFRKTFIGGCVKMTVGVSTLDAEDKLAILTKVQSFDAFDRNIDPYCEHDFVKVAHEGTTYFGKIDYYAPDLQHGSDDPADASKTARVLTVMRADEY